jgi:MarR family transcriptional regulator, transcriptional regulator for hemolysin
MAERKGSIAEYLKDVDSRPSTSSHAKVLYLIHELSRLVSTRFDKSMLKYKLTHGQWWAIMHLYENQGVSQSDLAQMMQMGRASAGKLLERMEAKGWIERRPDPADSRVRRVYLADGVVPVFQQMGIEGEALFNEVMGDMDATEEAALLERLRHIRRNADPAKQR